MSALSHCEYRANMISDRLVHGWLPKIAAGLLATAYQQSLNALKVLEIIKNR